jgi:hypothetical protein
LPASAGAGHLAAAGAALVIIGFVRPAAVALYDVDVLRSHGGGGSVGQIVLGGFYGLTLLAGVALLGMPGSGGLLSSATRRTFLALAAGAAAFVAVAQAVSVYAALAQPGVVSPPSGTQRFWQMLAPLGDLALTLVAGWLAVATLRSRHVADPDERDVVGDWRAVLRSAVLLGVVAAVLLQVGAAAGKGAASTLPGPSTPSSTQLPLPAGRGRRGATRRVQQFSNLNDRLFPKHCAKVYGER